LHRGDAGAKPAVRLGAMRHAGAGLGEQAGFVVVHVDEMSEPHVASEVVMVGHPRDPSLAIGGGGEFNIGHSVPGGGRGGRAPAGMTFGSSGASDQGGVVGAKATRRRLSGEGSW